jgi:hypothetical protein
MRVGDTPDLYATVSVELGEHVMPMVLDTGAQEHMLTSGVTWYLGLPLSSSQMKIWDANGDTVRLATVENLPFHVHHWRDTPPATFAVWDLTVASRLFGVVSPQALVGEGGVVLDFPADEMRAVSKDELPALLRRGNAQQARVDCEGDPVPAFTVDVDIEGMKLPMRVDTGAGHSTLYDHTAVAEALASRAVPTKAGWGLGGPAETRVVPSTSLVVAGRTFRTSLEIVAHGPPSQTCQPVGGLLGIDVLRVCTIVVAASGASVRC